MEKELVNLTRFTLEEQRKHPEATGDFTLILQQIGFAAKIISKEVNKAGLVRILGKTDTFNYHGEQQQKLDVYANEIFINSLEYTGKICGMASEEVDDIIPIPRIYSKGKYLVVFDPIDGSSNIDVNVSIGTIFGIYKRKSSASGSITQKDFLNRGKDIVAAGYIIYGSSTMFVYTTGNGVNGFTLDPSVGEFLLSHPNLRIPEYGNIYSVNEANSPYWDDKTNQYIDFLKKYSERKYTLRYIGSLVSDFHRNLLKGGVFLYPADINRPKGKLRLVYEVNPLAFIMRQVGGMATDGKQDILEILPESLHQTTPIIMGSEFEVKKYLEFVNN